MIDLCLLGRRELTFFVWSLETQHFKGRPYLLFFVVEGTSFSLFVFVVF